VVDILTDVAADGDSPASEPTDEAHPAANTGIRGQCPRAHLADAGSQVLIRRNELVKPCAGIATLQPGDVSGKIFDVGLHSGP
jgi:hypothetical protein